MLERSSRAIRGLIKFFVLTLPYQNNVHTRACTLTISFYFCLKHEYPYRRLFVRFLNLNIEFFVLQFNYFLHHCLFSHQIWLSSLLLHGNFLTINSLLPSYHASIFDYPYLYCSPYKRKNDFSLLIFFALTRVYPRLIPYTCILHLLRTVYAVWSCPTDLHAAFVVILIIQSTLSFIQ